MMLIVGTIPDEELPMTTGPVGLDGEYLTAGGQRIPRIQGTGAMISAALSLTEYLKLEPPHILVAGDIGDGKGTRQMYNYLIENIEELSPDVLVLHYCMPYMDLMEKLCRVVESCPKKIIMIADAGAMYAAKGAGLADKFDIMTPDPSEIAFLADQKATHPAYIAHHLFECDSSKIPQQIADAYSNKSAANLLLVKGKTDYVASEGMVLASINQPDIPILETIGGTGDTITGLVSAFVYAGYKPFDAAVNAVKTNRIAGEFTQPTPATKVSCIIDSFPEVFEKYLQKWNGVCAT